MKQNIHFCLKYVRKCALMKRTLLFSDLIGNILEPDCVGKCRFNDFMEKYLRENIGNIDGIIFINAPGIGNEENYFDTIIDCFEKINISFKKNYIYQKIPVKKILIILIEKIVFIF
jgi:hypothetical protein